MPRQYDAQRGLERPGNASSKYAPQKILLPPPKRRRLNTHQQLTQKPSTSPTQARNITLRLPHADTSVPDPDHEKYLVDDEEDEKLSEPPTQ